jgi:hypothetical protein
MSEIEDIVRQLSALVRGNSNESLLLAERQRKRLRRMVLKVVRTGALLALSTIVIVVGMLSTGLLLGPRGVEGLITAPLVLIVTWCAILYWSFKPRPAPRALPQADIRQLPERTAEWLDAQRRTLPRQARARLDTIVAKVEALAPQVATLDASTPLAFEVRKLLGEELVELVVNYQKVPRAMTSVPTPDGHDSPDQQLLQGLSTVENALARLHEKLAAEDLRALATQQRYLEMKYKRDDDIE